MIKHDCYRPGGSESVGCSDTRLEFVVQTLDSAERDFIARLEPVQDKWLVGAEHAGDFLHWLEARSHRLFAPLVHELFRPRRGDILPEQLELFLEQIPRRTRSVPTMRPSHAHPRRTSQGHTLRQERKTILPQKPRLNSSVTHKFCGTAEFLLPTLLRTFALSRSRSSNLFLQPQRPNRSSICRRAQARWQTVRSNEMGGSRLGIGRFTPDP